MPLNWMNVRLKFLMLAGLLLAVACTNNSELPPPARCVATASDPDTDGDGTADKCDDCPNLEDPQQIDTDHDGRGDVCDDDDDGDGVDDDQDNCPHVLQADQTDTDDDGVGDACDECPNGGDEVDTDGDGVDDCHDLCPQMMTSNNDDSDGDHVGDACDNCPDVPNAGQTDRDGDGIGDACDDDQPFDVSESTLAELHGAIESGKVTCSDVVDAYLARIARYDLDVSAGPPLNAFVMINSKVRAQAAALDAKFAKTGKLVGPLHCAVIVVKTNYGSVDTDTTDGALGLYGTRRHEDAWALAQLKKQGAILLGATAMDEFAKGIFGIGSASGRTGNAYNPTHSSGGSSAGTGVSVGANLAFAGTGTDNCASLTIPGSYNGLVAFRTTLGLVSTDGIFPSGPLDAVSGPMARTVTDLAKMLDAMATRNPDDSRQKSDGPWSRPDSYAAGLTDDGLRGVRIGVVRELSDDTSTQYRFPFSGGDAPTQKIWYRALGDLQRLGATIVENVTFPDFEDERYGGGFVHAFNAYLADSDGPVHDFGDFCRTREFSQSNYSSYDKCIGYADHTDPATAALNRGAAAYADNRAYVTAVMDRLDVDVLVFPTDADGAAGTGNSKANCIETSVTGLPGLTITAGYRNGLPVGLMFMGRAWDEATILKVAYAYEQATNYRRPPELSAKSVPEDVPRLDPAKWNDLQKAVAQRAFDEVLSDQSEFALTPTRFRSIVTEVLTDRGLDYLLP